MEAGVLDFLSPAGNAASGIAVATAVAAAATHASVLGVTDDLLG
jgi:hypothetical protein